MFDTFDKKYILIVGGAGFVGSNLTKYLLNEFDPGIIYIVDNLISSEASNIPQDPRVNFICGSIADDLILNNLPKNINFVFHLSCYHGNQSSIVNPIADHDNNTITSLKLFNHLKNYNNLSKVVYAAAGCAVAKKTYDNAEATQENAPLSLYHDSPYSISKLVGEMYGNYFYKQNGLPIVKARFQNIYGPGEILGAGMWRGTINTIWRNVVPTFIWKALNKESLPLENGGLNSRRRLSVGFNSSGDKDEYENNHGTGNFNSGGMGMNISLAFDDGNTLLGERKSSLRRKKRRG